MVKFYLLMVVFVGECRTQTFSCPVDGDGECRPGQYPDPQSCAHFYNCVHDVLPGCVQSHHQCPQLYAFDNVTRMCVLAFDAECDVVGDGIVFVGSSVSRPPSNPVPFDTIKAIRGDRWNTSTHSFHIREAAGLYFVALAVGVPARTQSNYILNLSGTKFGGITKTSTTENGYMTIGHDYLIHLYAADEIYISSEHSIRSGGNEFLTSLTIFSISNSMMDDTTAFSVAREDTVSGYTEPLPFNTYLYNSGLHYHPFSHTYTAPSAGIYYFSFSVGLAARSTAEVTLFKNFEPYVNIVRKSTSHSGTDTMGRAVMMSLAEGDQIYMVNEAGQTARSSPMMETSFSGFRYQPKHGNMVAWSVARTSSFSSSGHLQYPVILVNQGGAWQPLSNRAIIPRQGYYFIHIGGGVQPGGYTYLNFMVNNVWQFTSAHGSANHNGINTMSRSGILHLSVGDDLDVNTNGPSYSDSQMQTIFIGFLL